MSADVDVGIYAIRVTQNELSEECENEAALYFASDLGHLSTLGDGDQLVFDGYRDASDFIKQNEDLCNKALAKFGTHPCVELLRKKAKRNWKEL